MINPLEVLNSPDAEEYVAIRKNSDVYIVHQYRVEVTSLLIAEERVWLPDLFRISESQVFQSTYSRDYVMMTHCSVQNENNLQKCSVDSDYEAFLINIWPIPWLFFSHCIIISNRDMATLICKFWEP